MTDAWVRVIPRRSRARWAGMTVAARVMATTIGPMIRGTVAATATNRPPSASATRPRQLHWAKRSSHNGTAASAAPSSRSPGSPRTSRTGPRIADTNTIVGTAMTIPRSPPRAAPMGRAISTTAGWTSAVRPYSFGSRYLRTSSRPTIRPNTRRPVWVPPWAMAARVTMITVMKAPRYGTRPAKKATTVSGPARGTPNTIRIPKTAAALMMAVAMVPRM